VAKKKKKSGGGYLLLGILLGVILALAAVALWPEKKEEPILQKNPYEATDFVWNEGFLQCDGAVTGIDVSRFQGDVDWDAVKAAGVEFVFVRLGNRHSQDGTLTEDSKAKENLAGAKAAGLKIGAYFFSQAVSPKEAKEEAALAMEILGDTKLDLPLAYDWEIFNADGRTKTVTKDVLLSCVKAFCAEVESAGYKSMVYFNLELSKTLLDPEQIAQYPFWFAQYADAPELPFKMAFWQYSDHGTVPGIEGNVDLNLWFDPI
jgi:GH25 family lysozyme M1 (1,4-beta-N-acetylmuramidase)